MKPLWLGAAALGLLALLVRLRRGPPLGRLALVAALAAIAAVAVYGTGVVHPPDVEALIEDLGRALGPYTYVLVGVAAFLETGAFVGLVAPGETTMVVGGVIAGQGEIQLGWLLAVAWASALAGDTASFWLGRRLGRNFLLRHGPRVKITPPRVEQVERFFDRHGGKAVLLGRFIGVVRAVAPFTAGASRMRFGRFLPYAILGTGLWSATFVTLGYLFWRSFDRVQEIAGQGAFAFATAVVVIGGSIAAYRHFRVPAHRAAARERLARLAQRPALRPLARVAVPAYRRLRRPARFAWKRVTPGDLGLELTTLLAVLAVGTFAFVALLVELQDDPFLPGDLATLRLGDRLRPPASTDVAIAVTTIGDAWVVLSVAGAATLLLALRRRLVEAAVLAAGTALSFAAVALVKEAEGRLRPVEPLTVADDPSFPSGHAAHSVVYVAVAVALGRALPGLAGRLAIVLAAIAAAAAVGLSRVYLRVHFLSDVVAGWALSAAIFALCGGAGLVVAYVRHNPRRASR